MRIIIVESTAPEPVSRLQELGLRLRVEARGRRVLLPVTGDMPCAVAAVLLSRALGGQLDCVYVDTGLTRSGEAELLAALVAPTGARVERIPAAQLVFGLLESVEDEAQKRALVLGAVTQLTAESARMTDGCLLAGAHCAPGPGKGGGVLAETLGAQEMIAPLAGLTRDETARLGVLLGLPRNLALSQPAPADGCARRIAGPVTPEAAAAAIAADAIFRSEVEKGRARPSRYFACLDAGGAVVLRAFDENGVPFGLPWRTAAAAAERIRAQLPGQPGVTYSLTPATRRELEWY